MRSVASKSLLKSSYKKKAIPLAFQYCGFLKFLKKKNSKQLQSIVKNLPSPLINLLSEIVFNGLCGNIT